MIIRSQDKKSIINFDNIDKICTEVINPHREISTSYKTAIQYYCGDVETKGLLGTYSTEEKAIKVLDMIEKTYEEANVSGFVANTVFQMPEDSEV